MTYDKILVLDFGSQYNQLIARRIREMGVFSELRPHDMTAEQIKAIPGVKGIVFSGGPRSVYEADAFKCDPEIFSLGLPILGICYGMQLTSQHFGGVIERGTTKEYGKMPVTVQDGCLLFDALPKVQDVWMSHGDHVAKSPVGFKMAAVSENGLAAAIYNEEKRIYLVQFHPEVRHSVYGNDIIANFVFKICRAEKNWTMESYLDMQIAKVREQVGDKRVLCGLSGGVDSTVVAVLLHKAIGPQLTCMFIDHGMLRKNEGEQVMDMCGNLFGMNVVRIDARERFLSKLSGVTEPERKRKIIGNEFVYCFDEESSKLGHFDFLAQGTLYTDVIESGTKTAQTIKSHHNVGGLPKNMKFKLVEPLNVLFKDEVRALGETLGIPADIVWRQPFPGPGLAIRIIGDVTEEKLHIVRESDAILREEIARAGLNREIWQYFTVLTNLQSVGVMGDTRTYDYALGIRAVTSIDGMTADWARIPYDVLEIISRRIVNEVKGVNRIIYDITSKPPATIEWE
ncbi:MAG: glutamine-hydrolyzing GMP synthase [bacterium]|uniref:GMP synthase [glutamine-hydrolyzing] n=1 Tax=Candidatus Aphodosoma intestinipullorum TaxID=2840674 RepID=A0A940DKN1_9BACT|nr:glutamine-hydrolyzing GMP synthase [Candidatus Aphodosoma intestinipullorum]